MPSTSMPFPTYPSLFDKVSSLYDFKSEEVYPSSEAVDAPRISLIYEIIFKRLKRMLSLLSVLKGRNSREFSSSVY